MTYIEKMDMSYSYKSVLIKGMFENIDEKGRVRLEDITDYFIEFYEQRRKAGLLVEKKPCLYLRDYRRHEFYAKISRHRIYRTKPTYL
jgi:hypothetical protein